MAAPVRPSTENLHKRPQATAHSQIALPSGIILRDLGGNK